MNAYYYLYVLIHIYLILNIRLHTFSYLIPLIAFEDKNPIIIPSGAPRNELMVKIPKINGNYKNSGLGIWTKIAFLLKISLESKIPGIA